MAEARRLSAPAATAAARAGRDLTLIVENMHCGGCLGKVERTLKAVPGVTAARANLSARRVHVQLAEEGPAEKQLVEALAGAGYRAAGLATQPPDAARRRERQLLERIGVAGFAAANIMLLSVSVWAGFGGDMDSSLSGLFHWLSALIALPAIAYAGQPFFSSAATAIAARRLNMDVPISVAICLATAMSLFQTWQGSEQVYFDAGITLLFFLLIGRFLDQRVRVQAAGAAENLMALAADWASLIEPDGSVREVPARELLPGQRVLVSAGARVPADGIVRKGTSELDESLITGETLPRQVVAGETVHAGTVNLAAPIEVEASATEGDTLLAQIGRLMQAAEQGRGRYVRLADRAARIYAPLVHLLGLTTFLGWLALGHGWQEGLTAAIAVLIITCPCALALAVPGVQVAATQRLFRRGVIVKAPDALERLAEVDTVVLDKTGTLTLGEPRLLAADGIDPAALKAAAGLAAASRHPYARALVRAASERLGPIAVLDGVAEKAGLGLVRQGPAGEERLGSPAFVLGAATPGDRRPLWYARPGAEPVGFDIADQLRPDAREVARVLKSSGFGVELLSGDKSERVAPIAAEVGIADWQAECSPKGKIERLQAIRDRGRKVLMVGDGLNDAPALASGHASLSPATAADISRTAADAIWQGAPLGAVGELLGVARAARRLALQNFGIALAYNAVCVPLAMLGYVTPLIAAVAMSTSSIAVTVNALRLARMPCPPEAP